MLATLLSATVVGLDGRVIRVEVDVAGGLPGFTIVGLADAALQEARERVRGAIRNAGFVHPPRRITVNLAPAEQRKAGASLDLAIAMGILLGSEQIKAAPGRIALIGELSLGAEVRPVPGVLPMAAALARRGIRRVIVPSASVDEARLAAGIDALGVATLAESVELVRQRRARRELRVPPRVDLGSDGGAALGRRVADACHRRGSGGRRAGPRRRPRPARGTSRARDRACRVATGCCSSDRPAPGRRSLPGPFRGCCRRSTTRRRWRPRSSPRSRAPRPSG